ncbi:hypothetical protein KTO58_08850 [Chitinophaga pendula]|uniref:hypothetical protein n=1 Tax=Chitinophaga TaxID=79328 RepID=UPI000BAF58EE|nr:MULTISPECIES: hypothetical protein [Chitinophaga]ASZ13102.1 hypothetical protein CK934_20125 [Chitinophaga sp. MD30]UCJ09276.1 hypothetical protein KTO58_08850 [Chitinophaga pendula]
MKRFVHIIFFLGILLIISSYLAEQLQWLRVQDYLTLTFIGSLFIISAAAYLLLDLLYRRSRDAEHLQH